METAILLNKHKVKHTNHDKCLTTGMINVVLEK